MLHQCVKNNKRFSNNSIVSITLQIYLIDKSDV